MPDEAADLTPLVTLAAALRTLPHPEPSLERAQARQQQVMAAAPRMARPESRTHQLHGRRWVVPTLGAVLILLLCGMVALITLAGALLLTAPHRARIVTLTAVTGQVEVAAADSADAWHIATNGEQVRAGQRIRTGPASRVTLVFFEGTATHLGSNTDLTLTTVSGRRGKALQAELTQHDGETTHSVVPLRGRAAFFEVRTPAGTARVHGTTFNVTVAPDGQTRFAVDSGRVSVTAADEEVILAAGQTTAAEPGQAPEPPAYQFIAQGKLTAIEGIIWTIEGVSITVTEQTAISGDPRVGDTVIVVGRILDNGVWLADNIEFALDDTQDFSFTGLLEAMDERLWQVGGVPVMLGDGTVLSPNLALDDSVRVTFTVLADGRWLAISIEALDESADEPTPTPTATPDPDAQPSLSFEPDELLAQGCIPAFSFTGTLVNTGSPPDDYAANVELSYEIIKGAKFVEAVELAPSSWETIPAGEQVSFTVNLTLNESWRATPTGTDVKLRIFVANETNRPDHHVTRLTVTIVSQCDGTPSPTPSATVSITPTVTVTPTLTATPRLTPVPPTSTALPTAAPTVVATTAPCGGCRGGVTSLTLRYNGSTANTQIQVFQKKDQIVFDGTVQPGETFTFSGTERDGKLGSEITIEVNGQVNTKLHTSCSKPIGPGLVSGDFEVVAGRSKDGGPLCPVPESARACGKKSSLSIVS